MGYGGNGKRWKKIGDKLVGKKRRKQRLIKKEKDRILCKPRRE